MLFTDGGSEFVVGNKFWPGHVRSTSSPWGSGGDPVDDFWCVLLAYASIVF